MLSAPPATLVVDHLVVRTYHADDAPALAIAVARSIDHLRPWMPWIRFEPQTVEQRAMLIAEWAEQRASGRDTTYGIFDGPTVIGGTGLHRRGGPDQFEIGYWVAADRVGQGVAGKVAGALTDAAFAVDGVAAVEILHDRRNVASGRVPARLGYRLVEEFRRPPSAPAESGLFHRWRMTAAMWHAALVPPAQHSC